MNLITVLTCHLLNVSRNLCHFIMVIKYEPDKVIGASQYEIHPIQYNWKWTQLYHSKLALRHQSVSNEDGCHTQRQC